MQSDRQPIATRKFENADGEIELNVYAPVQAEDGDYECDFSILWATGRTKCMSGLGVDSMQALMSALSAARANLLYPMVGERDEAINYGGMRNLGIEIPGGD